MRVDAIEPTRAHDDMGCVAGRVDQSLRRGDVEGVRLHVAVPRGVRMRGDLIDLPLNVPLGLVQWRDGPLVSGDRSQITQLPAHHDSQWTMVSRGHVGREVQGSQ